MDSKSQPGSAWVLPVLCGAAFMASLDLFIVNVAFDNIGADFGGNSLADLSWILNAYAILYAALLVPLGRLADRFGQKAAFLAGLATFTIGSAACALSPGLWWLVAFRGLQAVGAAALTPTSLGLLLTATAPERRVRAVRIWAATGGLAAAAGPVAGGLLVNASWRWVFLVNVPIGILSLVVAQRKVADSRHNAGAKLPDLAAVGLLVVAIGAISLGLVKAPTWGWLSAPVLSCLAVSMVAAAVFWSRSLSHHSPVIEPALLRVRTFAWSNATALAFSAAFAAGLLSNILWLQGVWHYTALRTGLAITPGPLMVPLFAAISQRIAHRVQVGLIAAAGCAVFGLGTVFLQLRLDSQPHYLADGFAGFLITGIGVGLALPTILSAATVDLPAARAATGSGIVNMSRQIGTVLGVSVLVALTGGASGYAAVHAGFGHVRWAVAAASAVAAVAALGMTPGIRPISSSPSRKIETVQ
jgi:EmrB/QacA subfamily drug resistance transporter